METKELKIVFSLPYKAGIFLFKTRMRDGPVELEF